MPLPSTKAQLKAVAADPALFDQAVVEGALDLYNQWWSDLHADAVDSSERRTVDKQIEQSFGWVPDVLEVLASTHTIPKQVIRWSSSQTLDQIIHAQSAMLYMVGPFKPSLDRGGSIKLHDRKERISKDKWLDETLASVAIYSRYGVVDGAVKFVSVPCLTGALQCVAYAIAVIKLNRHGLGDRVRPCGFLIHEKPGSLAHHLFLTEDRRQRFCCPAHSNAQRQREFKRRHGENA